jgi:hypothetical protein
MVAGGLAMVGLPQRTNARRVWKRLIASHSSDPYSRDAVANFLLSGTQIAADIIGVPKDMDFASDGIAG